MPSANGISRSRNARSPVSLTYSTTDGTSHRWSSEHVSSRPWMRSFGSTVGTIVGDGTSGSFSASGSNALGSNRCRP
ncbi:Uncharacterised protein [Mycobacteroides abscessus]|nr:Uncharacterised protein [Mycobacteroides abscessus]